MAFTRYKGKTVTRWLPVTASTAITKGSIVSFASGQLIAATSSTTALSHAGVIKRTLASTDADYATGGRLVPVEVPIEKGVQWAADVTATLVAADVGLEVDLTDALTINRGASTIKAAICVGFISTVKGLFVLELAAGKM